MGATLRELAQAAGVSVATASRAMNRPQMVEESTRQRILDLARELDYVPNRAAQALSTGRTGSIGLVVPDLNNPFFTGIAKGALAGARATERQLLIADTEEDPSIEFGIVERLAQRTDALVLCSSRMSEDDLERARQLCPVVLVNRSAPRVAAVTFDADAGVRETSSHLRVLGHRRVAYAGGPKHSYSEQERMASLMREFPSHGLELISLGNFEPSLEGGRAAADPLLMTDATAVMAYNDVMALGLVGRLDRYGIDVPNEMSVVGWDDIEFAEMFTPPLTTVHIPREEAGRAAIEYLDNALADRASQPPQLPTHLVFRRTTARATSTPTSPGVTS